MADDIKAYEKRVYDRWGETYDRSIWVGWLCSWVKGYEKDVPEGSGILDIGCGTGNALAILVEKKPTLLAGLDISEGVLNVARRKMHGHATDLRVGDAEDLPWKDNTFDVALMTATIHHFPNPDTAVREAWRVLKPGGRLIVAEPHFVFPFLQVLNLLLKVYPLNGDLGFLSQQGLKQLVERCGFEWAVQRRAAFMARYTLCYKPGSSERVCVEVEPKDCWENAIVRLGRTNRWACGRQQGASGSRKAGCVVNWELEVARYRARARRV